MRGASSPSLRERRRAALAVLRRSALALLLALSAVNAAAAQETEPDETLPGSGIRYPRGYDAETEGALEGRIVAIEVPARGPVLLRVESGGREVSVLTAPNWFWECAEGKPSVGDAVRVLGSKSMGADGQLYVVAREILPLREGCGCAFRDPEGRPLWRGRLRNGPERRCAPPARLPAPPAR